MADPVRPPDKPFFDCLFGPSRKRSLPSCKPEPKRARDTPSLVLPTPKPRETRRRKRRIRETASVSSPTRVRREGFIKLLHQSGKKTILPLSETTLIDAARCVEVSSPCAEIRFLKHCNGIKTICISDNTDLKDRDVIFLDVSSRNS